MKEYEVYRADENDITYTQNFYSTNERSLNLLRSKEPVKEHVKFMKKKALKHNINFIDNMF